MRWLIITLLALFALLQYRLWLADGGLPDVWSLQSQIRLQEDENHRLAEANEALRREIEGLKTDPAVIEEYAREELGMVHRDETVYVITDE